MPTEEQLGRLREQVAEAETALKAYTDEIRLAEKAGFDVSAKRTEADAMAERIRKIKRVYGV